MIIVPLTLDQADIFGFVRRQALGIDKDTGVQAVGFAIEDDRAIRLLEHRADVLAHRLQAQAGDFALGDIFLELATDTGIELVELIVAPLARRPVDLP